MKVSIQSLNLLKHFLLFTGQKEVGDKGNEVPSARRLKNEESCQRRFFTKAIQPILDENIKAITVEVEKHNKKLEKAKEEIKKKNKDIKEEDLNLKLNTDKELLKSVKELNDFSLVLDKKKYEFEDFKFTDKTKAIIKKYFLEYGEKNGFTGGDDEAIAELNNLFSL